MTPTEFADHLAAIGWTRASLAGRLGCDEKLCRRWASGHAPIPPAVGAWLARVAFAVGKHPAPTDWRVRPT